MLDRLHSISVFLGRDGVPRAAIGQLEPAPHVAGIPTSVPREVHTMRSIAIVTRFVGMFAILASAVPSRRGSPRAGGEVRLRKSLQRRLQLEILEDRVTPAANPWVGFLMDQVNHYTTSDLPADLGSPMVSVYRDFNAGGSFATINDAVGGTLNGNDPNAGHGPSSLSMQEDRKSVVEG